MEQMDLQEKVRRQYEKTGKPICRAGELREEMLPMPDGAHSAASTIRRICSTGGSSGLKARVERRDLMMFISSDMEMTSCFTTGGSPPPACVCVFLYDEYSITLSGRVFKTI